MRTIDCSTIFLQNTDANSVPDAHLGKEIHVLAALRNFESTVFGQRGETSSHFNRRQLKHSACNVEVLSIEIKQLIFGIQPADKLESQRLIDFLRRESVEIIPVFWERQENKSSNVLSIRMNAGGNHFFLLNMNAPAIDFNYLLTLGFGHYIAIECMQSSELDVFAKDLAKHLLSTHDAPIRHSDASEGDEQFDRDTLKNLGEMLCQVENPDATAIAKMARERFGTRFFDAIGWIQMYKEPSPDNTASAMANIIASALCIEVADAEPYSVGPGLIIV